MAQKLLLFWRKPARRCWWEGVELDNVRGVEGKLKVWIRRVWTLEMVSRAVRIPVPSTDWPPTERHWPALSVSSLHFLCIPTPPSLHPSMYPSVCLSAQVPPTDSRARNQTTGASVYFSYRASYILNTSDSRTFFPIVRRSCSCFASGPLLRWLRHGGRVHRGV